MAQMDMSDALLSAELGDCDLVVVRRTETVDNNGFSVVTNQYFRGVFGVVCPADQNNLEQGSDEEHQTKAISIVTPFALRGVSDAGKPDVVVWQGNCFEVVRFADCSNFGPGFIEAIAHATKKIDVPPVTADCQD